MEKTELLNYRTLKVETDQLRAQLMVLESSLYSPKGQRFTTTPRAPSGERSTMDGAVERHIRLEQLYRDQLAEKEARQIAIETAIMALEDPGERVVMRERYITGLGWPAVIAKMQKKGFSERQVYRLHGFALLKLKEV